MNKFWNLFSGAATVTTLCGANGTYMEASTAGEVIARGLKSCKAIKLSQILLEDFSGQVHSVHSVRTNQAGADVENPSLAESFSCDKPDFFVSHSMHDDATAKWEALTMIANRFNDEFGREPNFWIDKYCIDQDNIAEQLRFLPVYVMCCERVLVLSGPTYFKRLWCCFELYVYSLMYPHMDNIVFWSLEQTNMQSVKNTTDNFKLCEVDCFLESDKNAIMVAVATSPGGIKGFEQSIQELGTDIYNRFSGSFLI
jgi:hypothetical protein